MIQSPDNIRIQNRQTDHKILWNGEPWRFLRLIFLSHPVNKGGCVWCGNIANTIEHDDFDYRRSDYLKFFRVAVPMCSPCNQAKRKGKILCPVCRKQGHYVFPGEVCWSCKSPDEREHLIFQKEHRNRIRNVINQKNYRKFHPAKKIVNGVWVTV